MKTLVNFESNSEFESNKNELDNLSDYAALSEQEREVHVKEIPNMVDIALWDATEENILMICGWDYNAYTYPLDRYTPIGVEVIPRNHMEDGKSRILALKWMNHVTPKIGSLTKQFIAWGMYNYQIENFRYGSVLPCINDEGSDNFGETQEIKRWVDTFQHNIIYFSSDSYANKANLANPFTNGEYYSHPHDESYVYLPSPYIQNMTKNPIFYTEYYEESNSSILLNMDGKGETEKILNQIEKNGNTEWKMSESIENEGHSNMIAPAAQCCWLYSTVGTNQGDWYLPTFGELVYTISRRGAINNSLAQINRVQNSLAINLDYGSLYCSSLYNMSNAYTIDLLYGNVKIYGKYIGDGSCVLAYMKV